MVAIARPAINVVTDALLKASFAFDFRMTSDGTPYWRMEFENSVTVELAVMDGWLLATGMSNREPVGWTETNEVFQTRTAAGEFGVRGARKLAGLGAKALTELVHTLVAAFPADEQPRRRRQATKKRGSGKATRSGLAR